MKLRRLTSIALLAALLLLKSSFFALAYDPSSTGETDTDSSAGDIIESQCASLDESLAGALGCDTSDEVLDFTTYDGQLEAPDSEGYDDRLTENKSAREFIQTIVNYALGFLGLIATVIIIYGGIMYVLSRGDEEMASKGKKSISYAAVGILIILASFAIVNTLLNAGGGDPSGSNSGSDTINGTTITETGASFDTDYVLEEIEDITAKYLSYYESYLGVTEKVNYMKSQEIPIIVFVTKEDYTASGLVEALKGWITGTDPDFADQYQLIDEEAVADYLSTLRSQIQKIQNQVDSLSDTYEASEALYNYLKNASEAQDSGGNNESLGCAVMDYNSTQTYFEVNFGVTISDTDIREIDEGICSYIVAIQTANDGDYAVDVQNLVGRFGEMEALFDTQKQGFDSGSKLTEVLQAFETADAKLKSSLETVNASTAKSIVESMNELHNLVKNLEFVKVRLSASDTRGNAPLIVRFDVLGTEDPSGKTVEDDQIEWDLNGDGIFESTGSLDTLAVSSEDTEGDSVSATYMEPGTYRVRVRVRSQDENIAAGVATVSIEVEPSKSKIMLTATAGTEGEETIADFRSFPYVDQESYKVTMAEAEEGIRFDATESTDGDGNNGAAGGIVYYRWDFGDNDTSSGQYGQEGGSTVTHAYGESGNYNVKLTVMDDTGVEDKKYFTLYVASPAARFKVYPSSGTVGTSFDLDGSLSTTDVGSIVSYAWSASKDGVSVALDESSGSSITTSFDEPGVYTVSLTVADGSGNRDVASYSILVESTPPVASFDYSVPNEREPATYAFDASKSYDPDEGDTLTYEWDIEGTKNTDYKILSGAEDESELIVQFLKKGDFAVQLTVYDQYEGELKKSDTAQTTISIDSILDVDMEIEGDSARHLDASGEVEVEVKAKSETASAFKIDYGDGEVDYTDSLARGETTFTHSYDSAGVFYITVTALDEEDGENAMTRRIYIGNGDTPIAVINAYADGEDVGFGSSLTGNIRTQFTFDASDSVNVDGNAKNLEYSWNFGDGVTSSQAKVTHKFSETATYTVTLTVRDEDDSSVSDTTTMSILIKGIDPVIHGLTVVPQGDSLETPLKVSVTVDAEDEDGKITYIKGWYYDLNDTATELGTVTAQSNTFTLTIDTKGETGEEIEYGFAAEVKDNQNNKVSSFEELSESEIPTLTVTNGPNENPVAGFTVDRTSIYTGEEIIFSSTSYDPDGSIVSYWWDVEGDGIFSNNEAQEDSSFAYTYTQVHPDGVEVRLKVEDSSGATATSEPLTLYVSAATDPPDAAFLTAVDGATVSFKNNSTIDTENGAELIGAYWDFDLATDSNGNGISDDDIDSLEENPSHTYDALGSYQVKFTVVDSSGQSDSVTQEISVVESSAPVASFTTEVEDKKVSFDNKTDFDTENGAEPRAYAWDMDLNEDSDGDGDPENDTDASSKDPTWEYEDYGSYDVKLTVEDSFGKTDTAVQNVEVESPISPVTALLSSTPRPNELGQIVLEEDGENITFYYSAEGGSGKYSYVLDKNIFYDTNGDGIRYNDKDYEDDDSGAWKTPFYKAYGHIVVKLTVTDEETGESDVTTLQVVFEGMSGGANLFNATPSEMIMLILSALLTAVFGVSMALKFQSSKRISHDG